MMSKRTRRGRPKGTGIDDTDRLLQLAELLRNRPELKPTTGIRLMGFTDPSAIRRLRDKYKIFVKSRDSALRDAEKPALTVSDFANRAKVTTASDVRAPVPAGV